MLGYTREGRAVPAWGDLALPSLRRLHISTAVGWGCSALAAAAAAAPGLRELTLTDNSAAAVGVAWAAALAPATQLSRLALNSCTALGPEAAPHLGRLTSLTGLHAFRCPRLGMEEVLRQLRAALPCLATLTTQE